MEARTIPRWLMAALLVATVVPCAYPQDSKPTIRHHRVEETAPPDPNAVLIDQAETAMQHNDFAGAEAALQKVIAAKPDDYRAWFDLGYVYNATQRRQQAVDAYHKAVAAKPDVFESNLNLGLLLAKQGENEEATKYLKAATRLVPGDKPEQGLFRAWQALGRVEATFDAQQALEAYGQAAKLNPQDPEPHVASGELLESQNHLDEAAKQYQAAIDLDATSTSAISGLVNVLVVQKKYSDAEAVLKKLLAVNPDNSVAHQQLARVFSAEGKDEEAAEALKAAGQANPDDPRTALALGSIYEKAGKNAEAEQQFRIAVQKMPQDAQAHYMLGGLLMVERKNEEAQQELLTALKLKPDLADAYGNLAVVAAANKDYILTLRALDARAKYLPEIPATYFLRATTFDNLKDIPHAVEYYQRFLAVDDGKFPDQEWQARHRLIALDPRHADKYEVKVKK